MSELVVNLSVSIQALYDLRAPETDLIAVLVALAHCGLERITVIWLAAGVRDALAGARA